MMVSFPLRLILAAYGGAALLGWVSWATGGTAIGAALVFWLGGTLGVFALPLLSGRFRSATEVSEVEAAAEHQRLEREYARWAEDLAEEADAATAEEIPLSKAG
jgi:hypothetical protein